MSDVEWRRLTMTRWFKRCLSIALLAALGFSHASLALAACFVDRADLPQMLAFQDHSPECCDACESPADDGNTPMSANGCVAQGTADLQLYGSASIPVVANAPILAFFLRARVPQRAIERRVMERPPAAVPPRILLHSFLI